MRMGPLAFLSACRPDNAGPASLCRSAVMPVHVGFVPPTPNYAGDSPVTSTSKSQVALSMVASPIRIIDEDVLLDEATSTAPRPSYHSIPAGISEPTGYLNAADSASLDAELTKSTTGYSREQLQELAGQSVAEAVYTVLSPASSIVAGRKKILIVSGPGNNGGDGLVAARHLAMFGFDVSVVYPSLAAPKSEHFVNLVRQCEDIGVEVMDEMPADAQEGAYTAIVDAVFGFSYDGGADGVVREPYDSVLRDVMSAQGKGDGRGTLIVSVDVPSGWNVDGGDVSGTGFDPDVLVSLTAPKLCAKSFAGRHFVGGRFLPPKLSKKYGVRMPSYQGVSQVMEVYALPKPETEEGGDSLELDYARRLAQKEKVKVSVEHGRGKWEKYGDVESFEPGKFQIKCFNKISTKGLGRFSDSKYDVREDGCSGANAHAILLRSHKLQEADVPKTVRAIARCGSGTNNIPVARMTELGVPVFNTPGANANAVKELVFCALLIGSRRIVDGINHMKELGRNGIARERVEKDKAMFGGREVKGKTLAIIGLGHIGSQLARDASTALDMNIVGYDPYISVENALKLPEGTTLVDSVEDAVKDADYISLHVPYIKGEGGTHAMIDKDMLTNFKSDAVLCNFARGELVDSEAMKEFLDRGDGRYVSDFPDDLLWDHKNMIILPHLGASTEEAEDCAASMAADTVRDYLETGAIKNSVNFPSVSLPDRQDHTVRFTVINENHPGVLAGITETFAKADMNIVQEINKSRGPVAYSVVDVDTTDHKDVLCFKKVQEDITMLEGVISSRIIYGKPGKGYAKNLNGEYFV